MKKEKKGSLGKFLLGAGVGAFIGMLFAPKTGKETRSDLKEKMDIFLEKVRNMDASDVREMLETKVREIKEDIKNIDKETVATVVKEQVVKIKEKADELVDYAIKKGTPVVVSAAKEVKKSTLCAIDAIMAKVNDKDNEQEPKKATVKNTKKSKE